jgi:hypothetical protein
MNLFRVNMAAIGSVEEMAPLKSPPSPETAGSW